MEPPKNTETIETPIFTMWLDELGILYFLSKDHPAQKLEESKNLFAEIKKISKGKKRCMLMDLSHFKLPTKEARDYGAIELPKMVIAIAFISHSYLGVWAANIFFTIKKQPYPTKMFTNEMEAKKWLKQYL